MPRAKKIKLVDKYIRAMSITELLRLVLWYQNHTDHNTMLKSESCGIGAVSTLRCKDCNVTTDITEYECW
jgi:hypothetical protein